jgi:hypothetical protein
MTKSSAYRTVVTLGAQFFSLVALVASKTVFFNPNSEFVSRSRHYSFWNNYRTATSTVANLVAAVKINQRLQLRATKVRLHAS